MKLASNSFFTLLSISLLLLAGTSCSKKVHPGPSLPPDYLPISSGSHWKYVGDLSEEKKITGNTKSFNGKTYAEGQTEFNGKTSLGYVFKENGIYYSRGFLGTAGDTLELIILKDNVAAGTSWYDTLATSMIPISYKFTIDQKDFSAQVNDKTYEHVIKVKMEVTFILPDTVKLIATEYISFAPGIGIIQFQTVSSKGSVSRSDLVSYEIK